jgi:hypothetical protein
LLAHLARQVLPVWGKAPKLAGVADIGLLGLLMFINKPLSCPPAARWQRLCSNML